MTAVTRAIVHVVIVYAIEAIVIMTIMDMAIVAVTTSVMNWMSSTLMLGLWSLKSG